jgi:hypothetical protein
MPLLGTIGAASARGFGRGGGPKKFGVSYLVLAGGGAASAENPNGFGGGGAGGYRISYDGPLDASSPIDLTVGETYPVTVGAGGPGAWPSYPTPEAGRGGTSSFATISSTGGGNNRGAPQGGSGSGTKGTSPSKQW